MHGLRDKAGAVDVEVVPVAVQQLAITGHQACIFSAYIFFRLDVGDQGVVSHVRQRPWRAGHRADLSRTHIGNKKPVSVGASLRIERKYRDVIQQIYPLSLAGEVGQS